MPLGRTQTGSALAFKVTGASDLLLRKQLAWADTDAAEQTVWLDWFFGTTPPAGATINPFAGLITFPQAACMPVRALLVAR